MFRNNPELYIKQNESKHRVTSFTKTNSKWITDLDLNIKLTKIAGENLDDLGCGDLFTKDTIHKGKSLISRTLLKLETSVLQKDSIMNEKTSHRQG